MSKFSKFVDFELVAGTRKLYSLKSPLIWEISSKGSGWELPLKAGLTFDISVPRFLEWAQDPHDKRVLLAALVHDELLRRGEDVAFASAEFRRALITRGISKRWAWLLFTLTLLWTAQSQRSKPADPGTT